MKTRITRRTALAAAGLLAGSTASRLSAYPLTKTWGEDFLTPWSPATNVKRNLIPGPSEIRLSCVAYRLDFEEGKPIAEKVKKVREMGYSAAESDDSWKNAGDSDIREVKDACREFDVLFYGLHICVNNIHPDPAERRKNQKRVAAMVWAAERIGLPFVVSHTGSCDPSPTSTHRDNWTRETWNASVAAIKQILKDTAGCTVNLAIEAINPSNINNPRAHIRLREDVGDPRVKVTLDPTNMLNPSVYYRTTELLNECFTLLGENILYAHAKDVLWTPDMLPSLKWVVPGMGIMDYEVYLTHLSRMKNPRPLLLEFLPAEQYPQAKKFIEETAARVGVKIHR
jgi:sugar phosphate isomerase/epimerase